MDTITGCWEGALIPDQGGATTAFALRQPTHAAPPGELTVGPSFTLGGRASAPARLLEGASRSLVALVEESRDPASGGLAQLLVEARVRGDRMVGHWLRRDAAGIVVESGELTACRAAG